MATELPARSQRPVTTRHFLWGYLKYNLYTSQHALVEEMNAKIVEVLNDTQHNIFSKAIKNGYRRAHTCTYTDGRNFWESPS